MHDQLDLDKAQELARCTDYARDMSKVDGRPPVNWIDAAAFFLEGYLYATHGQHSRSEPEEREA